MKTKSLILSFLAIAFFVVGGLVINNQIEPTIPAYISINSLNIAGLTKYQAMTKLKKWWTQKENQPIRLISSDPDINIQTTPKACGIFLNQEATFHPVPIRSLFGHLLAGLRGKDIKSQNFPYVLSYNPDAAKNFKKEVLSKIPGTRSARAYLKEGQIVLEKEKQGFELDQANLAKSVEVALNSDGEAILPLKKAKKQITSKELKQITGIESEYSTTFPLYLTHRNQNIRIASQLLNGHILLPGQTLSFNQIVGKRTAKNGFELAIVYRNGKQVPGVGGGICQVSTTLYNVALLANLKILKRQNHSIPVGYVPLGRDATVDYDSIDLVIQNSQNHPIAVSSKYVPGRLTFAILGKNNPSQKIEIETVVKGIWPPKIQYIQDPSLPPGTQKVIEKGGKRASVLTYRTVYQNGKKVSKQFLGTSYYRGAPTIIALNKATSSSPKENLQEVNSNSLKQEE